MTHCSKQSSVDFKPCMTSLFVKCSRSNKSHTLGKMCNYSVPYQNTTTMILRPRNVIFIVIVIVVLTKISPTSGSWRCLTMLCNCNCRYYSKHSCQFQTKSKMEICKSLLHNPKGPFYDPTASCMRQIVCAVWSSLWPVQWCQHVR